MRPPRYIAIWPDAAPAIPSNTKAEARAYAGIASGIFCTVKIVSLSTYIMTDDTDYPKKHVEKNRVIRPHPCYCIGIKIFFLLLTGYLFCSPLQAQQTLADTSQMLEILPGTQRMEYRKIDTLELQILAGNVRLKQGTTYFSCDSCVINKKANLFEAFGHVHINDSDTANIYSDYLRYHTDRRLAYMKGAVKLTDGHGTLTTDELEYDMISRMGTYTKGGKIVTEKSVLTSTEGVYYADLKDVYFKKDVVMKDPAFYLTADSLLYNIKLQTTRFISRTFIKDSSNRTIVTDEGSIDNKTGRALFTKRTTIVDKALTVTGDEIADDDSTGIVQIRGRGVLKDSTKGISILANDIFVNKRTEAFLATNKPLMIIKQAKDSIYITADTLFSARLSDRGRVADSVMYDSVKTRVTNPVTIKSNDTANRYFEAYRHVRVFSDSVQAVSDSLFYSFKDSTFRLFQKPVVWSTGSQISGDTIYLQTRNRKAERVKVFENSFLASELQAGVYNQIRSNRMDGYFREGVIDSVQAKGLAESIYFIQDEDSAFSGINQTESEIMDVYFNKGELSKVVFRTAVKGTLWPINQRQPAEMRLKDFQWMEDRRPKTKFEMFE